MWGLGGGGFGGGFPGAPPPPRRFFEEQYHCYSVAYADKAHLEVGTQGSEVSLSCLSLLVERGVFVERD